MQQIKCDYCKKKITSNKNFIAVTQIYPKFPFSKFHTACYSNFLKENFWVITSKGGAGVINGKNGNRGVIIAAVFAIFFIGFSYFATSSTVGFNWFFYFFILIGSLLFISTLLLRLHIYYNYEKHLK